MLKDFTFVVNKEEAGIRLDLFLTKKDLPLSRSRIQELIKDGQVKVDGREAKPGYKIKPKDKITLLVPEPEETEILPEEIKLDILYEDSDLLVINKPQGMVVHPAGKIRSQTLVNALLFHCPNLSGIGGKVRPGIVHRLDKETSGLLVIAKNDFAHQSLSRQIKERTIERRYKALVWGEIKKEEGEIHTLYGRSKKNRKKMEVIRKMPDARSQMPEIAHRGQKNHGLWTMDYGLWTKKRSQKIREAITRYKVLKRFKDFTLIEVRILTGRTHQIRVHTSYLGHPVVGDKTYGRKRSPFNLKGQLLHAETLGFVHPRTGEYLEFKAPLPETMRKVIKALTVE